MVVSAGLSASKRERYRQADRQRQIMIHIETEKTLYYAYFLFFEII